MEDLYTARRRPFTLPARLADLEGPTVRGVVKLPNHLDWSSDGIYDLDDPVQRRRVYEIVLQEGLPDDLHRYLDIDDLVAMFPALWLPDHIRTAWSDLLQQR